MGFFLSKMFFLKMRFSHLKSKCSKKCSLVKFNKSVPGDIFEDDDLRTILFKKDIIDLVKDILEKILFTSGIANFIANRMKE